jgi:hypothetical protein
MSRTASGDASCADRDRPTSSAATIVTRMGRDADAFRVAARSRGQLSRAIERDRPKGGGRHCHRRTALIAGYERVDKNSRSKPRRPCHSVFILGGICVPVEKARNVAAEMRRATSRADEGTERHLAPASGSLTGRAPPASRAMAIVLRPAWSAILIRMPTAASGQDRSPRRDGEGRPLSVRTR